MPIYCYESTRHLALCSRNSKYSIHRLFILNSSLHKHSFITAHFVHHCTLKQALTNSYLKRQNFIPDAKRVTSKKTLGGEWVPPPLGSPKVKNSFFSKVLNLDIQPLCSIQSTC